MKNRTHNRENMHAPINQLQERREKALFRMIQIRQKDNSRTDICKRIRIAHFLHIRKEGNKSDFPIDTLPLCEDTAHALDEMMKNTIHARVFHFRPHPFLCACDTP